MKLQKWLFRLNSVSRPTPSACRKRPAECIEFVYCETFDPLFDVTSVNGPCIGGVGTRNAQPCGRPLLGRHGQQGGFARCRHTGELVRSHACGLKGDLSLRDISTYAALCAGGTDDFSAAAWSRDRTASSSSGSCFSRISCLTRPGVLVSLMRPENADSQPS